MTQAIKQGYKQTEIGVIPEDWEVKTLGKIVEVKRGSLITSNTLKKGNIPVVAGGKNPAYYHNKANRLNKTITISASGANAGYVNLFQIPIFASDCSTIEENKQTDLFFIYYQLKLKQKNIYYLQTGGAQPHIHPSDLNPLLIPLPNLKEQQAIAQALSDTDNLIESLNKLILKKKDVKQGTMQLLLTGKKRLPGFSGEWEEKKIGEILDYEQPVNYIVKNTEYSDSNDIPVLTANKAFILGYTDETEGIYSKLPSIIFDDFTLDKKYVSFPFKVKSSAIKILTINDGKSNLKFMFEKMQLIKLHIGDHKRYYISEYQEIKIKLPFPKEQTAIANILLTMDEEIEILEKELNKYKNIKTGMMQQLLTGSIRLKW